MSKKKWSRPKAGLVAVQAKDVDGAGEHYCVFLQPSQANCCKFNFVICLAILALLPAESAWNRMKHAEHAGYTEITVHSALTELIATRFCFFSVQPGSVKWAHWRTQVSSNLLCGYLHWALKLAVAMPVDMWCLTTGCWLPKAHVLSNEWSVMSAHAFCFEAYLNLFECARIVFWGILWLAAVTVFWGRPEAFRLQFVQCIMWISRECTRNWRA